MPDLQVMTLAALKAMRQTLDLNPEDSVLVIGDAASGACPDAFLAAARAHGCPADIFRLPEARRPLTEMPAGMGELLEGRDVVINAIAGRSDEIPFRLQWIRAVEARDLRMGHSPGIVDDMMEGGALDVDYAVMAATAKRLFDLFADADSVRITTDAGTDLVLGVAGRPFVSDVHITLTEKGVNLPCGEVYCCPVESRADGVLVIDGCFGSDGNVSAPATITCREGRVVGVTSTDPDLTRRIVELMDTDEGARNIAELGVGLNPGAALRGNMLEDEKALRTAHVAFGSNEGMPGGQTRSKTHIDYLFHRPTMVVTRGDGTTVTAMTDGDIA